LQKRKAPDRRSDFLMKQILTITLNPTIDRSTSVDRVIPERKLRCRAPADEPGGGGINVSRAIRKLEGYSSAVYSSGGPFGRLLQDMLTAEGVDHYPVSISGWTRENLIVLEETTGQQFRFGMPGPHLEENEWRNILDRITDCGHPSGFIIFSGSFPTFGVEEQFFRDLAGIVRDLGSRLIIDTSGEALRRAVRYGSYLIKPNMTELRDLAGRDIGDESDIEDAAAALIEKGWSEAVVVSLGAAGALLKTRDMTERLRAPTVPIRSKVGAGDSMVAGIALSLARGQTLSEAVRFGVAAGASAVMTPGSELCRKEDTERLFKLISGRPPARAGISTPPDEQVQFKGGYT